MDDKQQGVERRALALMPHPDDCEILCAGTLLRLRDLGWEVHVATMAAGDMGSPDLPREEIAAIRREEARRAALEIGAASYRCLEFEDVEIVFDRPSRHRVAGAVRQVAPSVVLTTPPNDYMFDHVITSQLVRDACFSGPIPNYVTPGGEPPLPRIPWLYYTDPLEGNDILGERAPVSVVLDITAVMDRKARALACHASQREWLLKHHGVDDYIEAMKRWCARRGQEIGTAYAEGFCQHRGHPHPTEDLLGQLLGSL